jgi:hypothetical protein
MLFGTADLHSLLCYITWTNIHEFRYGNPVFRHVLPTQSCLSEMVSMLGLSFCAGLWDLLNSADPPSISWLQEHHADAPPNVWGIYLLILRKSGQRPLVYVGSGTAAHRGLRARLSEHSRRKMSPTYLKWALANGYDISHTILLATCPIPSSSLIPVLRTTIVALESSFAALFWALQNKSKSYGYQVYCP